jgi:hypothetical protein
MAEGVGPEGVLLPTSHNVLTVIGILPHQYDLLRAFFRDNGLTPDIDPPDSRGSRGNWAYLWFDRPITSIPCIQPRISLSDHLIVGCIIGQFQREVCIPVPEPSPTSSPQKTKFFKMPRMDENLTALPMKEKTWWVKVREFIFGERSVERPNESILGSLYDSLSRRFLGAEKPPNFQ